MVLKFKSSFSQLDLMKSLVLVGINCPSIGEVLHTNLLLTLYPSSGATKLGTRDAAHTPPQTTKHSYLFNPTHHWIWIANTLCGYPWKVWGTRCCHWLLPSSTLFSLTESSDIPDLFCDPFPQASWFLPTDFPFPDHFTTFNHQSNQTYGNHDRKALAEIYLLSLMDEEKLVTSGWSTFGYVAQALAGVKPWILYRPQNNQTVPDPPCG